jgi:WD40 repeat protein
MLVAGGGDDGNIKIWDVTKKEVIGELKGHKKTVTVLAFQPKSTTVFAAGSADGVLKLWDLTAKKELQSLDAHKEDVKALAFTADGKVLATAGGEAIIKLWDTTKIGK